MPYHLEEVKRYYVVDTKGKKLSKEPLTKEKAKAQMYAVFVSKGTIKPTTKKPLKK
jgi:hypothetical protein